jgi:hypothetical protein
MKRLTLSLTLLVAFMLSASQIQAGHRGSKQFDKLKSLVGEWQGKAADGKNVKVSYELISNGTALLERLMPENEPAMVTLYHSDGGNLMLTHYCSANNQPRMRAEAVSGDTDKLRFTYFDATNLANPEDGHMDKLVLTFQDQDHITHDWTWLQKGQENLASFKLERVK